jgi:hypothetical protein
LAAPNGPCQPAEVSVTPVVSKGNRAGDPVKIRLQIRTTGRPACTMALNPADLAVKVSSGVDSVWTSQQCPGSILPTNVTIRRTRTLTFRVEWSGHRSTRQCRARAPAASPGTYVVAAAVIGGEPAQSSFVLVKPKHPAAGKHSTRSHGKTTQSAKHPSHRPGKRG